MRNIFEGHDEEIANKKPFLGKLDIEIDYTWDQHIEMIDTHPREKVDQRSEKMRIGLNAFHSRPSAPDFAREIIQQMQDYFMVDPFKITNIAFAGFGRNSGSYPWHKDSMDVFLVQVKNSIMLRVEGIGNETPFRFEPGDYVWLPRGTHHEILPNDSRLTFSFGIETKVDPSVLF